MNDDVCVADVQTWADGLDEIRELLAPRFARSEPRAHALDYVRHQELFLPGGQESRHEAVPNTRRKSAPLPLEHWPGTCPPRLTPGPTGQAGPVHSGRRACLVEHVRENDILVRTANTIFRQNRCSEEFSRTLILLCVIIDVLSTRSSRPMSTKDIHR